MSDKKDEYDEVKDDIFSNLFQDPIVDDSMLESSSLSLEIVLDVPIFDKYSDEEEDFKSCEELLTTKISSSPTFQQRDDQIVSFETFKDDEQIFVSTYDSFESTTDPKGISQFQDLQRLEICSTHEEEDDEGSLEFPDLQGLSNLQPEHQEDCSRYNEEDDVLESSDQQSFLYDSLTEDEQSIFNIKTSDGEEEQRGSNQQLNLHSLSTEEEQFTFSIETSESNQQL
jgi:hypothetical protein